MARRGSFAAGRALAFAVIFFLAIATAQAGDAHFNPARGFLDALRSLKPASSENASGPIKARHRIRHSKQTNGGERTGRNLPTGEPADRSRTQRGADDLTRVLVLSPKAATVPYATHS